MEKNRASGTPSGFDPSSAKVTRSPQGKIQSHSSPFQYTQTGTLQFAVVIALVLATGLAEGIKHWRTTIFFSAVFGLGLLLREMFWGHGDLLDDYFVEKDVHYSPWLFVFGQRVKNGESNSLERKRLLRVTSSGRKFGIRIIVFSVGLIYAFWIKKNNLVEFRPSSSLYLLVFSFLLSAVFICQVWVILAVSALIALVAVGSEWGQHPIVFGFYLAVLFFCLGVYRINEIQWIYANERKFKKRGRNLKLWNSVVLLSLIGFVCLWFFNLIVPDSKRVVKNDRVGETFNQFKLSISNNIVESLVKKEEVELGLSMKNEIVIKPAITEEQRKAAKVFEDMIGKDPKLAESLASRLSDVDLKALESLMEIRQKNDNSPEGSQINPQDFDKEAYEKFVESARNSAFVKEKLKSSFPDLEKEIGEFEQGVPASELLRRRLRDEFVKQRGPIGSLTQRKQDELNQLGEKIGLKKSDLEKVASTGRLTEEGLERMHSEGEAASRQAEARERGEMIDRETQEMAKAAVKIEAEIEGASHVAPLSREKRLEKIRSQIERLFSQLERWAKVLLYLGALYLAYLIFFRLFGEKGESHEAAENVDRIKKSSLLDEARMLRSRSMSSTEEVILSYQLFLRLMELIEFPRLPEVSPTGYAEDVSRSFPKLKESVSSLTDVFCNVLYGENEIDNSYLSKFRSNLDIVFKQFNLRLPKLK
ncbi:MAG: hypothetical protein IPJ71_04705 [Bdellovibrionales bacterium]|nr:hypothetical protein [Bdellovibrionales bacterium]